MHQSGRSRTFNVWAPGVALKLFATVTMLLACNHDVKINTQLSCTMRSGARTTNPSLPSQPGGVPPGAEGGMK